MDESLREKFSRDLFVNQTTFSRATPVVDQSLREKFSRDLFVNQTTFSRATPVMDESLREKFSRDLFVNQVRKWEDLPTDCLVNIFEKVDDTESRIEYLPFVCKSWFKASLDPQCWKILDFSYLENFNRDTAPRPDEYPTEVHWVKSAIMFAVHHSCGKASKVVFPSLFLKENMLEYVLERCAELKSLVAKCYFKDELKCIPKQIYKLKDLESLSLLYNGCHVVEVLAEILPEIHTHCKKFVSLTLRIDEINTEVASAIVTFVPNVKQLVLRSCKLYREGLKLILSGCKELELLDVRDCILDVIICRDGRGIGLGFDAEILTMASHIKNFMSEDLFRMEEEDHGSDDSYHMDYNTGGYGRYDGYDPYCHDNDTY